MTLFRLLWLISLIALTGCAGRAVAPAMYLLDTAPPASPTQAVNAPIVIVDNVDVAPYLDEPGIVYQTGPHRVILARNNRWASPLSAQLTGGLQAALESSVPNASIRRSGSNNPSGAFHLVTTVDAFMGHYDGHAHIDGRWRLINGDGERVAGSHFSQRVPLRDDGYDALVESLSRGWQASAQTIGQQLSAQVVEP